MGIENEPNKPVPKVYAAISAVQAQLAIEGIAKDSRNAQQGYNFRGIDAVYNALSPILALHKLCILPRILKREVVERESAANKALFYVTVEAEFDIVAAEDGSKHIVRTFGEAMDSGDKATNKAMSAAYKYAVMQAFAIPTQGDNDADATTHDVKPQATTRFPNAVQSAMRGEQVSAEKIAELEKVGGEMVDLVNQELAERVDNSYKLLELVESLPDPEYLWLWDWLKPHTRVRSRTKAVLEAHRQEGKSPAEPSTGLKTYKTRAMPK